MVVTGFFVLCIFLLTLNLQHINQYQCKNYICLWVLLLLLYIDAVNIIRVPTFCFVPRWWAVVWCLPLSLLERTSRCISSLVALLSRWGISQSSSGCHSLTTPCSWACGVIQSFPKVRGKISVKVWKDTLLDLERQMMHMTTSIKWLRCCTGEARLPWSYEILIWPFLCQCELTSDHDWAGLKFILSNCSRDTNMTTSVLERSC